MFKCRKYDKVINNNPIGASGQVDISSGQTIAIIDNSDVLVTGGVAVDIIKVTEGEKKEHESKTVVVTKEELSGKVFFLFVYFFKNLTFICFSRRS
jgi:hypothetical protein